MYIFNVESVSSEQGDGSSGVASRKPVQVVRTEHPNYVALSIVYDDTPKTEAKPKAKKTPLGMIKWFALWLDDGLS